MLTDLTVPGLIKPDLNRFPDFFLIFFFFPDLIFFFFFFFYQFFSSSLFYPDFTHFPVIFSNLPYFGLFFSQFSYSKGGNVVRCHFFPANPLLFSLLKGGVVVGENKKPFFF